ncbi:hypothetical protein, partial [Rhodococcus sp. LB1]|uniref:hypothetical protein n=1 Tax=Rhodococcus sp. LB1 TaxID=1807499 RepID=UPI001E40E501
TGFSQNETVGRHDRRFVMVQAGSPQHARPGRDFDCKPMLFREPGVIGSVCARYRPAQENGESGSNIAGSRRRPRWTY